MLQWREIPGDRISASLSVFGHYIISHRPNRFNISFNPPEKHFHVGCETTIEAAKATAQSHLDNQEKLCQNL